MTSRGLMWGRALVVDVYPTRPDFEVYQAGLDHHCVTCILAEGRLTQTRRDRTVTSVLRRHSMLIRPSRQEASWRGHRPAHMRLRVPETLLDEAWLELGSRPSRPVELLTVFSERDPFFDRIATMLQEELRQAPHPAQRLLVESMTSMVTAHLVRKYCSFPGKQERHQIRLSAHAIQRVREYVHDNLGAPIDLQILSDLCGLSSSYFGRAFRTSMGITPTQFVEECRMEQAMALMRSGERRVGAVARSVGYADQSHFARRFAVFAKSSPTAYCQSFSVDASNPPNSSPIITGHR